MLEEDLTAASHDGAADATRIRRSAGGLLQMIAEVLDFAELDAGRLEVVAALTDIEALLLESVEKARADATAKGNVIEAEFAPSLGRRLADPVRLKQCVEILLSNAVKFTDHGRICVSAAAGEEGRLVINVTDTGVGISEEDQQRLFLPFVQVESGFTRGKDGAGLGLAIASKLAAMMGGDLNVKSALNEGSTFTLTIMTPAAPALAQSKAA